MKKRKRKEKEKKKTAADSAVNNGRLVGNKRMNNAENRDLRRETVLEVQRERERERESCA